MKKYLFFSLLSLISCIVNLEASSQKTLEESIKFLKSSDVKLVEVLFSDINGTLKRIAIPTNRFSDIAIHGLAIDGSSIKGLNSIQESDSLIIIDLDSLMLNPFESHFTTASVFGSVYHFDGTPHPSDPRALLEAVTQQAKLEGYKLLAGTELEFFLFSYDQEKNTLVTADEKGYCDASETPALKFFQDELFLALSAAELNCEKIHHEVAPGQFEVVLEHSEALHLADRILYAKHIIKTLARKHNMFATFMPKPISGVNGSGMHIHVSIQSSTTGRNIFFDKHNDYFLSTDAQKFISGLLQHAREINVLFNGCPNSFKRLIPGYEAPFYLCVGSKNRSAAIRIPEVSRLNIEKNNGSAVRIELRWPDAECNPYLALSGLFQAGLEGMRSDISSCSFLNTNLYHADRGILEQNNIKLLPGDLHECITLAQESSFLKELLGENMHHQLIDEKKNTLEMYLQEVVQHDPLVISNYELENGV